MIQLVINNKSFVFNSSHTSSHLHSLQLANCESNSRLVADEDYNRKFRLEMVIPHNKNMYICIFCLQHVEFRINKGVLGLTKEIHHKIWEFKGPTVSPHTTKGFHDFHKLLQVPVMPPTLADVCKVIELYYVLKVSHYALWQGGQR